MYISWYGRIILLTGLIELLLSIIYRFLFINIQLVLIRQLKSRSAPTATPIQALYSQHILTNKRLITHLTFQEAGRLTPKLLLFPTHSTTLCLFINNYSPCALLRVILSIKAIVFFRLFLLLFKGINLALWVYHIHITYVNLLRPLGQLCWLFWSHDVFLQSVNSISHIHCC